MIPELMSTEQVMAAIGVKSRKKFRQMCANGEIPPPVNLSTRPRYWRKDVVLKLLGGDIET